MRVVYMGGWQTENDALEGQHQGSAPVTAAEALVRRSDCSFPANPRGPFLGKARGHLEKKSS